MDRVLYLVFYKVSSSQINYMQHKNAVKIGSNCNVEHDIITRDAYNVSWAEIWELSKSQRDIIDVATISKIIVFEIICNVAY